MFIDAFEEDFDCFSEIFRGEGGGRAAEGGLGVGGVERDFCWRGGAEKRFESLEEILRRSMISSCLGGQMRDVPGVGRAVVGGLA